MPTVAIAGGGLAGLAAAAALGEAGYAVQLFEARSFLGGRATSYPVSPSDPNSEVIDNCQHILLRCCVNLLDFYHRLGVDDRIAFHRTFYFVEPGGRTSEFARGPLPAPLHFTGAFLQMASLSAGDKLSVARGLFALRRERRRRDLTTISMLDWLREKRQTSRAIERFWRQILVSAINEELDRMAACHGFQVFWLGFLAHPSMYEMGIPAVPLADLYSSGTWAGIGNVSLYLREPVQEVRLEGGRVRSLVTAKAAYTADYYISALSPDRVGAVVPGAGIDTSWVEDSPITGIHLWFDRQITSLPHATLLDRTLQWMFNKSEGRYLQLVVSASRSLIPLSRNEIIDLAIRELAEFFPVVRQARLEKAHVVKEIRATFSAAPGIESKRPEPETAIPNLFLAGDWTRSGWPATMEGAVRSGYRAAEAVTRAAGKPRRFLLPDVA